MINYIDIKINNPSNSKKDNNEIYKTISKIKNETTKAA